MKQSVPPAAFAAAIVVFLVIACYLGFKALNPDNSSTKPAPVTMSADQQSQYNSMSKGSPAGSGNSAAQYEQYQRTQRQQQGH